MLRINLIAKIRKTYFVMSAKIITFANLFKHLITHSSNNTKMEAKEQVLKAMREAGQPVNAGKVAEMTGLDRKIVDKAFDALKKEGAIVSPVRCKWEPAK